MSTTTETPAWARGFHLEYLRRIAACFKATDEEHALGAFSGFNERDVAEALARDELLCRIEGDTCVAAVVWHKLSKRQPVKDFTGQARITMLPGDVQVKRMAVLPGRDEELFNLLRVAQRVCGLEATLFLTCWQEHRQLRDIVRHMGGQLAAVKIPASSELVGVYAAPGHPTGGDARFELNITPPSAADQLGLAQLDREVPAAELAAARVALGNRLGVEGYADHYSSYNKRHAWAALSLRGYGPPDSIVKPAEMSKAWKAEHPHMLEAPCTDTHLRAALPELEPLIGLVPGEHQRIRLMLLRPGGGELTRHADITDPEAGTAPGKVLRIHVPIVTNPGVVFTSWTLEGRQHAEHMRAGELWYLDTRKPHTAVNGGTTDRIHLVVDTYSTPELLELLCYGRR